MSGNHVVANSNPLAGFNCITGVSEWVSDWVSEWVSEWEWWPTCMILTLQLMSLHAWYTEQRINVLVQCGKCLQKLHDIGVVHRDVKPENFLLSTDGDYSSWRMVICDFGVSTICSSQKNCNTSCGTTSYKAPEIVQDRCQATLEKKVLYIWWMCSSSLSIIFFYMLQ